jgi:ADP-ribosylation factor-binding protein GGA
MDSNLRVITEVNRPVPEGPILLKAKFSNNASQPIQDLTFQMAVTKV